MYLRYLRNNLSNVNKCHSLRLHTLNEQIKTKKLGSYIATFISLGRVFLAPRGQVGSCRTAVGRRLALHVTFIRCGIHCISRFALLTNIHML